MTTTLRRCCCCFRPGASPRGRFSSLRIRPRSSYLPLCQWSLFGPTSTSSWSSNRFASGCTWFRCGFSGWAGGYGAKIWPIFLQRKVRDGAVAQGRWEWDNIGMKIDILCDDSIRLITIDGSDKYIPGWELPKLDQQRCRWVRDCRRRRCLHCDQSQKGQDSRYEHLMTGDQMKYHET